MLVFKKNTMCGSSRYDYKVSSNKPVKIHNGKI